MGGSVAEGEGDGVEVKVAIGRRLGVAEAAGWGIQPRPEQLRLRAASAAARQSHRMVTGRTQGRHIADDCNPISGAASVLDRRRRTAQAARGLRRDSAPPCRV